jgi:hypothetical protein
VQHPDTALICSGSFMTEVGEATPSYDPPAERNYRLIEGQDLNPIRPFAGRITSVMNWRRLRSSMGSPLGTRRASLPQAQDAPEAPAGPWGRPEMF